MNLGLGTSGGIGERKSEVSGHRDVTYKPAQEIQMASSQMFTVQFLKKNRLKQERTKGMLHAIT